MTPKEEFQKTVASLMKARVMLDNSLPKSPAGRKAREYSIQGLYLVGVRSFEGFLEDQIHSLASGRLLWKSREVNGTKHVFSNRLREDRPKLIREIVLGGRPYADYLPYNRTIDIANRMFSGGLPFTILDSQNKKIINRCLVVRHYIAHRSASARAKFVKEYQSLELTKLVEPRPIHYLDGQIRSGTSLFEHDLAELAALTNLLS